MKNNAALCNALALHSYENTCNENHAMPIGPKNAIGEGRVRALALAHFIDVNVGISVPISRGSPPLFLSR